jgi:hypothetical protein
VASTACRCLIRRQSVSSRPLANGEFVCDGWFGYLGENRRQDRLRIGRSIRRCNVCRRSAFAAEATLTVGEDRSLRAPQRLAVEVGHRCLDGDSGLVPDLGDPVTDRPTRGPAAALALLPPRWHAQLVVDICDVADGAAPVGVVDQVAQIPQKLQLASPFSPSRLPGISCHDREFRPGWLPHLGTRCDLRLAEMSHAKASSEGEKAKCIATTLT